MNLARLSQRHRGTRGGPRPDICAMHPTDGAPDPSPHVPVHFGARLFRKASIPSRKSWLM